MSTKNVIFWKESIFCKDPSKLGISYYAGSSCLTTAFCLMALQKYSQYISKKQKVIKRSFFYFQAKKNILNNFYKEHLNLKDSFRQKCLMIMNQKLSKVTVKENICLPNEFYQAFFNKKPKIKKSFLLFCAEINFYGWVAYSIFDGIEDENGRIEDLPLAMFFFRKFLLQINEFSQNYKDFAKIFFQVTNLMDEDNLWEAERWRVLFLKEKKSLKPSYYQKPFMAVGQKSLGCMLTSLMILECYGFMSKTREAQKIIKFFQILLSLKQINDDLHDWEDDLLRGRLNWVSCFLFQKKAKLFFKFCSKKTKPLSKEKQINILRKVFWEKTILQVVVLCKGKIKDAEEIGKSLRGLIDVKFFQKHLMPLKTIFNNTLTEKYQVDDFLKECGKFSSFKEF